MVERTHTRRAVLAALPAATAGAIVPAAAAAAPIGVTPIGRLMAERASALLARDRAYAIENSAVAELNAVWPPRPAELELSGLDLYHLAVPGEIMSRLETDWTSRKYVVDAEILRAWTATPSWRSDARAEAVEGVHRLLSIAEHYETECQAALVATGRAEAEAASDAAYARAAELGDAIIAAPVATVGDLAIKARVLQECEGLPTEDEMNRVLADIVMLADRS